MLYARARQLTSAFIISTFIKPIIIIYWFFNKTNNNYLLVFARAPRRAPAGALDPRGRRALVRQCGDAARARTPRRFA